MNVPNGQPCTSPSLLCASGGTCQNGTCRPSGPAPEGTRCNDGNPCTYNDTCHGYTCYGTAAAHCCLEEYCSLTTGVCTKTPRGNGAACGGNGDGNPCTYNDVCDGSGNCAGTPIDCEAQSTVCVQYSCNGTAACTPTYSSSACDDHQDCTYGDHCQAGVCVGTPITCSALGPCETSTCNGTSQCAVTPLPAGHPCPVGEACSAFCNGSSPTCQDSPVQ